MERIEHENGLVTNVILNVKHESKIREFCAWTEDINLYYKSSKVKLTYLDGLSELSSSKYHKKSHP